MANMMDSWCPVSVSVFRNHVHHSSSEAPKKEKESKRRRRRRRRRMMRRNTVPYMCWFK
jgi:hypothetical protein